MSDCKISVPFTGSAEAILSKAKAAIESQNGIFRGDEISGEFEVTVFSNTIKGNYSVTGKILYLVITDKPFFVTCSMIENILVKQIS
jgi:hypothetical protein